MIFVRCWISWFSVICFVEASLTFKNLPLRGNTPNLSLPITSMPANANDLAESPSVRIIVQRLPCFVPARLASSSLGMPNNFCFFLPGPNDFTSYAYSFAWATAMTNSTTPEASISFKNLSLSSYVLPKLLYLVFRVSFVWLSKAGLTTKQLTKTQRLALI